jgi:hypothetical protein
MCCRSTASCTSERLPVRKLRALSGTERNKKVNALIEQLTAIWGGDAVARALAWNVATWRLRRGLTLDIKKVLP